MTQNFCFWLLRDKFRSYDKDLHHAIYIFQPNQPPINRFALYLIANLVEDRLRDANPTTRSDALQTGCQINTSTVNIPIHINSNISDAHTHSKKRTPRL